MSFQASSQANFNHLRLDNFNFFRSDFVSNVKKIRKIDDCNKENDSGSNMKKTSKSVDLNKENASCIDGSNMKKTNNSVGLNKENIAFNSNVLKSSLLSGNYSHSYRTPVVEKSIPRTPFSDLSNSSNIEGGMNNSKKVPRSSNYSTPVVGKNVAKTPFFDISNSSNIESGMNNSSMCFTKSNSNNSAKVQRTLVVGSGQSCLSEVSGGKKQNSVVDAQARKKHHRKVDPEVAVSSTSRLFEEIRDDVDYDNVEHSTVQESLDGSSDEEEDLFWDDDYIYQDDEEDVLVDDVVQLKDPHVRTVPDGYATLGPPTAKCSKCDAIMWKEERVNKNVKRGVPKFSICCSQGEIKLPPTPPTPGYLTELYSDPKKSADGRIACSIRR
ncbi:hypothetical protein POM88_053300 [Heracleum sosnowskyi]|uniref:Uncharacterized protein n=1 Tax=Heracleum sosnowskyi TaxID=360622 RepID=A0AAD8GQP8_9APIA|nr:hypothetical protein POM88_053300 [Heracleum sosnowskyi]